MKFGEFLFTLVMTVLVTLTIVFWLVGHGKLCGKDANEHIRCVVVTP